MLKTESLSFPLDSLDVKKVFWQKSMQIPGTPWTIKGYSRSAYRTGFYIKDLDLMLDAGPQNFNFPKHIFITHSHGDHIALLPFTLIGYPEKTVVQIFGPSAAKSFIQEYIDKLFTTNAMIPPSSRSELDNYYIYNGKQQHDTFKVNCNNSELTVEVF